VKSMLTYLCRYFYGRKGGRTSIIDPPPPPIGIAITSTDIHPAVAPRKHMRPALQKNHNPHQHQETTIGNINEDIDEEYASGHIELPSHAPDLETSTLWSLPHLDNTPAARLEKPGRQVILFCLGFLFPICWWVAAFLPLPRPSEGHQSYTHSEDIEAWGTNVVSSKETRKTEMAFERKYENARWWRRINRALSVVGVIITLGFITLALCALHLPSLASSSA
jgi:hypothetical protein